VANKRWNKIKKLEADMKGLLDRTASYNKETNIYSFRSKEAKGRYEELLKSYEENQEKLKREIEKDALTKIKIPKEVTVSQAFDGILISLKEAELKIQELEEEIRELKSE
jgi:hypothetical protein